MTHPPLREILRNRAEGARFGSIGSDQSFLIDAASEMAAFVHG